MRCHCVLLFLVFCGNGNCGTVMIWMKNIREKVDPKLAPSKDVCR